MPNNCGMLAKPMNFDREMKVTVILEVLKGPEQVL